MKEIDRWHKARGWSGIGYHYLIRKSGHVSKGRSLPDVGAHCLGLNEKSIGICVAGHGDQEYWTLSQAASLVNLCKHFCQEYKIPTENVIGHCEVNNLAKSGLIAMNYITDKTCPGKLIDMGQLRFWIS